MKKVKYQCQQPKFHGQISPFGYDFSAEEWFNFWAQYPAIKHNPWYNSLGNRTHHVFNRAKAKVEKIKRDRLGMRNSNLNPTVNTARLCPNIREFLTRCMVIRAPMDMHFAQVEGHIVGMHGHDVVYEMDIADTYAFDSDTHEPIQFRSDACGTFQDHVNIKVPTGIQLDMPKDMQCLFLQPFYDNPNAPFKVIQGVFTEPLNHAANLIWNVMVNKNEVEDFIIKKGDALMYLYFPERVKFVKHDGKQGIIKTRWSKPKGLVTDEVKKKCPMEV